ncbi:MAG: DUF5668 domain-containing protein [Clostridiales bacterium]|nr:DUF5668 domain-containing protein [Clostridiales bacterium]
MDGERNINAAEDTAMISGGQLSKKDSGCRTHRVGTITCGLVLIMYGVLFLLRMALPMLNYEIIFRLWPVILILLGVEILACSIGGKNEEKKFIYDFPAVLIIIMMLFIAMVMAVADFCMTERLLYHL